MRGPLWQKTKSTSLDAFSTFYFCPRYNFFVPGTKILSLLRFFVSTTFLKYVIRPYYNMLLLIGRNRQYSPITVFGKNRRYDFFH